jgi:hypothetical protein
MYPYKFETHIFTLGSIYESIAGAVFLVHMEYFDKTLLEGFVKASRAMSCEEAS